MVGILEERFEIMHDLELLHAWKKFFRKNLLPSWSNLYINKKRGEFPFYPWDSCFWPHTNQGLSLDNYKYCLQYKVQFC